MAAAADPAYILVVDDDESFRAYVREVLERAGFRVGEAGDGEQALAAVHAELPNLVVLDVLLPGVSGYEVLRRLQETVATDLPVILVSGSRTDKEDVVSALLLGADDYVVKPFDPDELLARIRLRLGRRFDTRRGAAAAPGSTLAGLTARELEVLELLTEGMTQSEIAVLLVLSPRTVGTHIQHILSKLEVRSRAQAVALALRSRLGGSDMSAHVRARVA